MSAPASGPPVPPPPDSVWRALGQIEGRLGAVEKNLEDLRTELRRGFDRLDGRLWWLVAFVLTGLAAQLAALLRR